MTTFHGRLLISSLPDLRGIWGLSYDEGSVISTVASASQLILAPILPFFLTALGLRRLLLPLSLGFVCVAFCIPFISGYENLLVAHALMGLLIGSFVTATIQIMLKHLPPPWWVVVLAFFTFRVSLGINSGVSLGAFYLEYMGWQWIYWQSGLIMFVYFVLLQRHLPPDTPIRELLHKPDYSGMAFYCLSAVLIYAGLDQGERLGWFDSGIITVFLAGGIASFLLFLANEALVERPWAPPRLFADFNIIMSVGMVIIYIFILSANSLLITLFLDTVHDLRPLQSGLPLLLVALLQLLATPFCAFLVLKTDTRLLCATGVLLMGLACYQGTFITADWVAADFFPMAILFAIGHPLVFLSLMAFCMACFTAKTAVGLLAYIHAHLHTHRGQCPVPAAHPAAGGSVLQPDRQPPDRRRPGRGPFSGQRRLAGPARATVADRCLHPGDQRCLCPLRLHRFGHHAAAGLRQGHETNAGQPRGSGHAGKLNARGPL